MTAHYLTTSRVHHLAVTLSDREWNVIATVRCVRVATARQLERLHFVGVTRRQARSVMASLVARRVLARLPRVVGGVRAGSAGFVYVLDVAGLRLGTVTGRVQRPWPVGALFLSHSLAITELLVQLVEAQRSEAAGLELVDFRAEPACWRSFPGPGGGTERLKPDAAAVLRSGGYEDRWFIEVDRATESRPTLARKLGRYVRYWQTGQEQARTGVFPRVLWVVPDAARQAVLAEEFARTPAGAWPLFVAVPEDEAIRRLLQGAGV